jgi:hypothetical protein
MKESRRRERERQMARATQSAVAVDAGREIWMLVGGDGEEWVYNKQLPMGLMKM